LFKRSRKIYSYLQRRDGMKITTIQPTNWPTN
jgi:hypothetical protein